MIMATLKSFNNYKVYVSSHPKFNEWIANIYLMQNNACIVDVRFVSDPDFWASHGNINTAGVSTIYVGIERYPWFVDILRNEKPLFVSLYPAIGATPVKMILQTGTEPVGEDEGN